MTRAALLALLLALTTPSLAPAQEPRPRTTRTLDVAADDVEVREVLADIARRAGATIVVDQRVRGTINLTLRQVSWRDAVTIVARQARCTLEDLPGGGVLVRQPERITVQLEDADLRTALLLLARYGGRSIVIGPDVRGRVTLDLRDVEWSKAFRAIVATSGDYVVLGLGEEGAAISIGEGGEPLATSDLVLTAELLRKVDGRIQVRLDDDTELDLEVDAKARGLLERTAPGARLVLACERRDGQLVVTSGVVESGAR